MMSKSRQPIILHVIWASWLIPWFGKKWAPDYFGHSAVQWGGAILVAILVPIAVLGWWRPAAPQGPRKASWFFLIHAMTPLLFLLVVQGVMIDPLSRTVSNWAEKVEKDAGIVSRARDLAIHGDDPEKRERAAAAAYQLFGIRIDWRDSGGNLEHFTPSEDDIAKRERHQAIDEQGQTVQGTVRRLLKEMKGLFVLNTVSLAATLGAIFWRKKPSRTRSKPVNSTPET